MADTNVSARRALASGSDPQWADTVLKQTSVAGYEVDLCKSAEEALKRMAFIPYELVIIDEQILREDKRVLPYLVTIPMQLRRKAIYMITGPKYKTMENLRAFSLGVDGIVNYNDLHQLAAYIHILRKELVALYREFSTFVN